MRKDIGGVVLSGGKSSRMGREKGLILYHDKPLIQYSIDLLKKNFQDIYISTNNKAYCIFGLPLIPDVYQDIGPLGGIQACLEHTQQDVFVLGCDMPNVTADFIQFLVNQYATGQICVPKHHEKPEPLCAIYPAKAKGAILQQIHQKKYKLIDLLKVFHTNYVELDSKQWHSKKIFRNINATADLE